MSGRRESPRQRLSLQAWALCAWGACCTCAPSSSPRRNAARHFLAGSISAAGGVTLLAPIETIRLNALAGGVGGLKALEGGSWWRGNGFEVLAAAPRVGITMAAFSIYKGALASLMGDEGELPQPAVFVAGAIAGATATLVTHPLDVIRTRIAVEGASALASCMHTLRASGPRFLYHGLGVTLVGILPHSAVKLSTYDWLRRRYNDGMNADNASLPPAVCAAFGALAGVAAATSCLPLEVVRRRQMMGRYAGLSTFMALGVMLRDEGARSIVAGAKLNTLKVSLSNALGFFLYELCKDMFEVDGRVSPLRRRRANAAAAAIPTAA